MVPNSRNQPRSVNAEMEITKWKENVLGTSTKPKKQIQEGMLFIF